MLIDSHMITAQGAPDNFMDRWADYLNIAPGHSVSAPRSGYVAAIDGVKLGHIVVALGGGRQTETDRIDASVGLSDIVPLGAPVRVGQPLAILHAHDDISAAQVADCFEISDAPPDLPPLIHEVISP